MSRIGWLDCASGVSGDMLLGALDSLGALRELPALLDSLADLQAGYRSSPTTRHGLAATAVDVSAPDDQPTRRLDDVLAIIASAQLPDEARSKAAAVFRRLAEVEAGVHAATPEEVHFHEVGAVDSVVDVLAGCLGLCYLGLEQLVVSPIALGGGTAHSAHGPVPVPTPAALGLLAGSTLIGYGGPEEVELATPTGVALLAEWATATGPMPAMTIDAIGVGAGRRDLDDRANVVRLVVGSTTDPARSGDGEVWQTIEANVDDLDPRLWPGVLDRLIRAGAADAWLTPILMKKGRPAHIVTALVAPGVLEDVRQILVTETSTIGVRMTAVTKRALERSWLTVDIGGEKIRVKIAHDGAQRTNLAPEFDDVAAAAEALGAPVKDVLARATAAALRALDA